MASLLTHSKLKLWIWIVIIAAGSIIVLFLLGLGWWCCARRKSTKRKGLPSPVLAPTRKVTIRRGRMVSTSRYLSLTGSKFGLGQFMNMEEKDQVEKGRGRSKSPFTWWLSTMQDRSQSRQSHMSSQPAMGEVHSPYFQRPEPAFYNAHTRKESATSDYSLPSILNGRELAEDARVDPLHMTESSTSPHSSRYVNFSRAFSPLHHSTLRSTTAPNVLSQIVESSPRHSTVSYKPPSVISTSEVVSNKHRSTVSTTEVVEADFLASISHPHPTPIPAFHPLQTSSSLPDHLLRRSTAAQNPMSRFSFTTETSVSPSTVDISQTHSAPNISHLPANPRSGPLPPERIYPPTSNTLQSVPEKQPLDPERNDEVDPCRRPAGSTKTKDDDPPHTPSMTYWKSRPDLQPVRKLSKKGNVLRKKSLRRAEIVSWVGN